MNTDMRTVHSLSAHITDLRERRDAVARDYLDMLGRTGPNDFLTTWAIDRYTTLATDLRDTRAILREWAQGV